MDIVNFKNKIFLYFIFFLPFCFVTGPFIPEIIFFVFGIFFLFNFKEIFSKKIFYVFSLFCLYLIINSLSSDYFTFKSLVYVRFLLFLSGAMFFLKKSENYLMQISFFVVCLLFFLSMDGIFQYFFDYNLIGLEKFNYYRTSGMFGKELILGSFLSRFYPVGLVLFLYKFKQKKNINYFILFYLVLIGSCIFISGERAALFIFCLSSFLIFLFIKDFRKYFLYSLFICLFFLTFAVILKPSSFERMYTITKQQLTGSETKDKKPKIFSEQYQKHYVLATKLYIDKPILGHGYQSFRYVCNETKYRNYDGCGTHPHNFYLQALAELGSIGFLFLIIFYFFLFYKLKKNLGNSKPNIFEKANTVLIINLIVQFFPFMPSGSLFNNWLSGVLYVNILYYFYSDYLSKKFKD